MASCTQTSIAHSAPHVAPRPSSSRFACNKYNLLDGINAEMWSAPLESLLHLGMCHKDKDKVGVDIVWEEEDTLAAGQ
jgi:hypothetical protein